MQLLIVYINNTLRRVSRMYSILFKMIEAFGRTELVMKITLTLGTFMLLENNDACISGINHKGALPLYN